MSKTQKHTIKALHLIQLYSNDRVSQSFTCFMTHFHIKHFITSKANQMQGLYLGLHNIEKTFVIYNTNVQYS